MFDIDGFLDFMPAQEGEAREMPEEHHPSLLPLSTAPPGRENLSRLKKFSSSSSSLHSNGNCLLHTTVCPARLLLLDTNMLDANFPVGQRGRHFRATAWKA